MNNNTIANNGISQYSRSLQFDLTTDSAYQVWRKNKLSYYPANASDLIVAIQNVTQMSDIEIADIKQNLLKFNMVIYSIDSIKAITSQELCDFAQQLGLNQLDDNICSAEDRISTVAVAAQGRRQSYIPYTNKAISWHTDGYYNSEDRSIRSFILHCIAAADSGGDNELLDPDIMYILLRDQNPDYIRALMQQDVLTIPENIEQGIQIRAEQVGPVFSIDTSTGNMHMRYTARSRSIKWLESDIVTQAVSSIKKLLENNKQYIFKYKLQAGQGLLCNNVLHNRSAFNDDSATDDTLLKRKLLRARYYNRIK